MKSGVSLLLAAAWLWIAFVSGSEEIHAELHPDSDAAHHHCAVSDLALGNLDAAVPAVHAVPPPSSPLELSFPSSLPAPQDIDLRLDPGRAPPA